VKTLYNLAPAKIAVKTIFKKHSIVPKEFLQRAEEGLEKNLQLCHKNAKIRLENMTPRVYTTLRRRKEDLPWLLSMRN
jgi:hypothetical protein